MSNLKTQEDYLRALIAENQELRKTNEALRNHFNQVLNPIPNTPKKAKRAPKKRSKARWDWDIFTVFVVVLVVCLKIIYNHFALK